jgi:hypothetical protein
LTLFNKAAYYNHRFNFEKALEGSLFKTYSQQKRERLMDSRSIFCQGGYGAEIVTDDVPIQGNPPGGSLFVLLLAPT